MTDALAGQIITGVVTLGAAFIGYLKLKAGQEKQKTKIDELKVQTDGKMNELLQVSKSNSLKQGQLEGLAAVDAKELVKAVDKINGGDHKEPTPVIIVDQEKTIEVKETPDKK